MYVTGPDPTAHFAKTYHYQSYTIPMPPVYYPRPQAPTLGTNGLEALAWFVCLVGPLFSAGIITAVKYGNDDQSLSDRTVEILYGVLGAVETTVIAVGLYRLGCYARCGNANCCRRTSIFEQYLNGH